jgi:Bacteriophage HK97-gp10, putative tail-component
MISIKSSGSFKNLELFLGNLSSNAAFAALESYGQRGVDALARATPVDSGLTAQSWTYKIIRKKGQYTIVWNNTNVQNGVNVAILLQYGHGTGTGGWVEGRDYINPAIQPVFDQIANEVWEQMTHG